MAAAQEQGKEHSNQGRKAGHRHREEGGIDREEGVCEGGPGCRIDRKTPLPSRRKGHAATGKA